MSRISIILFFFLLSNHSFSQKKKIYFDESGKKVSSLIFDQKLYSSIYYGVNYHTKDYDVSTLYLNYYIGKIDSIKKHQLFSLLSQRNQIDTTKTILIHYKDSLKSIASFPEKDTVIQLKNGRHKHLHSHITFLKQHENCVRRFKRKKDINVYHFYTSNDGHPEIYDNLKWHKDHLQMLKKLFSNRENLGYYWHLVIHPNGDYFVYNRNLNTAIYRDLMKQRRWKKHLSSFIKKYNALNPKTLIPNSVR
ncbi:hypothetical protein [Spongiivirga citrea]|uniref:Uncharacterized protein n=1 Tax=Spongiivirga citrea TaxID=1481457 RepID=A0A6M0CKR3_9FLAO|nr:hypothetical protein [Spongiivirga citrea]NER18498.1 hypothetical protein [Spongiivirga citrea]